MSPRLFYRTIAIAEAVTWTLLIGGMLLKYVADAGGTPVRIAGSLHGFVFISYALTAVLVGLNQRWPVRLMVLAVATAIVPYATVPFDIRLDRSGRLDGDWRRVATDDPRDHTWVGTLLRWMLNRPVILISSFAVAAVAIMTVMLSLGPPGGRS
ncbi:DUF3817 domain-containing protein [Cryobacterium sp. TMT1-62]|uniref:DUF3817 domain-containing protein n=1 Tax=unclassified Cryobacterium TaxID=2649013 RepID=UPI001069D6F2|nr:MULTISPECIES: DUF3817 domain-containing protein [unclassified Cryobacterium]TFB67122.1 DUF3817 domain-containing protein [Cryobacterium sp. Hz7]TFC33376.1 DUF3817 domain-containing protein [Cryobacterium sp. TMT2-14]TFC47279.1 DUF3817 domain-containing protein [Cryobacterium sp. TMT2-17-1]TFC65265.1 DUF3817 domain-containing protein [Cryobacterium sp. TMT2-4]TFD36104.1 DUF3817 domain-containing protein [Cryobacterium sp. TMT1-62]